MLVRFRISCVFVFFVLLVAPRAASAQSLPTDPLLLNFVAVQADGLVDMNQPAIWIASGIAPLCGGSVAGDEAVLEEQTHQASPLAQKTLAAARDIVARCEASPDDYAQTAVEEADAVVGWDLFRANDFAGAAAAFGRGFNIGSNIVQSEMRSRDPFANVRKNPNLVRLADDGGPTAAGFPVFSLAQYFGFLDEVTLVATYDRHWADICKQRIGKN